MSFLKIAKETIIKMYICYFEKTNDDWDIFYILVCWKKLWGVKWALTIKGNNCTFLDIK